MYRHVTLLHRHVTQSINPSIAELWHQPRTSMLKTVSTEFCKRSTVIEAVMHGKDSCHKELSLTINSVVMYTVSQKKQNYFCYNYVKLPPNRLIFGTKMANCLKLYAVHSFSTSPNLCQCTTVLIADVANCHLTLQL